MLPINAYFNYSYYIGLQGSDMRVINCQATAAADRQLAWSFEEHCYDGQEMNIVAVGTFDNRYLRYMLDSCAWLVAMHDALGAWRVPRGAGAGLGKLRAYLIGMLQCVEPQPLMLTPTRELLGQVCDVEIMLGKHLCLHLCVCGCKCARVGIKCV